MSRPGGRVLLLVGLALGAALVAGVRARRAREDSFPGAARRWFPATPSRLTSEEADRLATLPYLRGSRPPATSGGVLLHDAGRAQKGLNVVVSAHGLDVDLLDMDGRLRHRWRLDVARAFPGLVLEGRTRAEQRDEYVRAAAVLPDGALVAMAAEIGLARLAADSTVVWSLRAPVHHDFFLDRSGFVHVLTHETRRVPQVRASADVVEEFLTVVSPEGAVVRRVSILDSLRRSAFSSLLERAPREPDILHANSVVVLDGSLAAAHPLFREGRVLVSLHRLNAVVLVDPAEEKVVWAATGDFRGQHAARFVPPGRVILFDNLGALRMSSRIVELDPATSESRSVFGDRPGETMFSETCGSVERLANGNTLIVESNAGRAFEIAPDRRVVWAWESPHRAGPAREFVATLYSVTRVPEDLPFLKEPRRAPAAAAQ